MSGDHMATDQGQTEIRLYPKKSKPTSKGQIYVFALINLKKYSGTPLYGHLLNTNTRIIKTQFHLYVAHIFFLKFALNTSTS